MNAGYLISMSTSSQENNMKNSRTLEVAISFLNRNLD